MQTPETPLETSTTRKPPNPERGEVDIVVGDRTWRMRTCSNAMILLEKATGERAVVIQERFKAGKETLLDVRSLLWALVQEYQPGTSVSAAGDLLDDLGRMGEDEVKKALGDVFEAGTPEPSASDPRRTRRKRATKKAKRRGGTGAGSSRSRGGTGSKPKHSGA